MPAFQHIFRLGRRPGEGVFCDADGLSIGEVALLQRASDSGDARPLRPRAAAELNRELSLCYGLPIEIQRKIGGLEAVAQALSRGDIAHAQMVALHLRFPDPPDIEKAPGDVRAIVDLALRLDASGLLKGDWDANLHPRWPAGSPDSVGGQFSPKDSQSSDSAASGPPGAGVRSGPRPINAQTAIPAPGPFLGPFDLPWPALPNLPSEIAPPPIIGPSIAPLNELKNPYPNRPECVEEWAHAREYCNKLLKEKKLGRGDYKNMGKFLYDCIMGQISEECGGNPLRA